MRAGAAFALGHDASAIHRLWRRATRYINCTWLTIIAYEAARRPAPITAALCWAHARRQFFELADIAKNARRGRSATAISPIALAAVQRIDALFDIERTINGLNADQRRRVRQEKSAPRVAELEAWLRDQRSRLSRSAPVIKPIDYMLKRWAAFTRFLEDGRICLTNNLAERALRGLALGRKAWLFAGSDRGADRAAVMFTLIMTAKLNDVDPQAWLADVFTRVASLPQNRLHELLPWEWRKFPLQAAAYLVGLRWVAGRTNHTLHLRRERRPPRSCRSARTQP